MTREEALKRVKGYLTDCLPADCYREVEEIIEALEQEPCEDCISREAVNEGFKKYDGGSFAYGCVWDYINKLPSVTPKERTGYWIPLGIYDDWGNEIGCKCSECGELDDYPCEYCSNCGTRMDGEVSK